jgi:hypothetical protein
VHIFLWAILMLLVQLAISCHSCLHGNHAILVLALAVAALVHAYRAASSAGKEDFAQLVGAKIMQKES